MDSPETSQYDGRRAHGSMPAISYGSFGSLCGTRGKWSLREKVSRCLCGISSGEEPTTITRAGILIFNLKFTDYGSVWTSGGDTPAVQSSRQTKPAGLSNDNRSIRRGLAEPRRDLRADLRAGVFTSATGLDLPAGAPRLPRFPLFAAESQLPFRGRTSASTANCLNKYGDFRLYRLLLSAFPRASQFEVQ